MAEELFGADLTEDGVQARLVRTRAVVSETLRLFPAAFTLVREAILPDRIGTLQLPRRAVVMIAPWVLHRHHAFWPDPRRIRSRPASCPRHRRRPDLPSCHSAPARAFAWARSSLWRRRCWCSRRWCSGSISRLRDTRPVLPVAVVTTQPDHAPLFELTRRPL